MKFNNSSLLGIAALILALSVAYYILFYIPQQDRLKAETVKQEPQKTEEKVRANKISLDTCISTADTSGQDFWDKSCKSLGLEKDCALPSYNADQVNTYKKDSKSECFKKYPQN